MSAFRLAPCDACDRDVLLVGVLQDGHVASACIHCDQIISDDLAFEVADEQLAEHGYDLPQAPGSKGERGCRDGQCGVRQA